ncbi:hypothetical protein Peur_011724 [Populus x canadensis]
MEELHSIDGVAFGSALHIFATQFFCARSKREILPVLQLLLESEGVAHVLVYFCSQVFGTPLPFRLLDVEWLVRRIYETETAACWLLDVEWLVKATETETAACCYYTLNVWLVALEW